ncbi:peptidoglycan-binding protein [Xanthomonas translucens pv. translucens]|uniref:Peptidoglycan-binding protein n=2 Tax=Xanthomonas campestris pv. translucens TaxID=343 RepID=A0A109HR90_XANCT|nr:peptidoglycan-binding protein [Xanthomonas translucens]KWV16918.1 peptidoglycan-binding protein [Xanthomonas translucens]QSQ30436.1 peptidoglycan-binding protein [Xanthomonas translucens pv. translucens]QSQ33747.1 peptidoglycan-binding protein [Xanthomonas translucens pv. translucens]QSQ45340.1 peptidoglycan-binding protein [Xanthomonas translucens pv. translucens]UNU11382.1 peptidoglycan-binding protein [Xanthomonas translucens pv. translucens]
MARDYTKAENLDIIEREAKERHIPVDDFMRFAYIETGGRFNEQASRGPNSAKGLFQFTPGTAAAYGISGRELDAVANTDAAARLYQDNLHALTRQHDKDHRPYLSGKPQPDGLDMYMAHQQGAGGYRSIQAAVASGSFAREDTRSNILNNVPREKDVAGARQFEAYTGSSLVEFKKMSDQDMAKTFLKYWDTKFDHIAIPEKGIKPVTEGHATQPVPPGRMQPHPAVHPAAAAKQDGHDGIQLTAAHAMGIKYDDVQYAINIRGHKLYHPGVDGKQLKQGYIDCSGWVSELQNATMREINQKAGHTVFGRQDMLGQGQNGSGEIVKKAFDSSGVLLQGQDVFKPGALKEGMVIGVDAGKTQHEHWKGIDHILMVVRDPKSGELLVSQSSGIKGVNTLPLDDYLASHKNAKLFVSDPLAKARDLLQDKQQTQSHNHSQGHDARGGLKPGEQGPDVKAMQQRLIELGIKDNSGKLLSGTGYYGDRTREVVANLQREKGLEPTGIADKITLEALSKLQAQSKGEAKLNPAAAEAQRADNPLFTQALEKLQKQGPNGGFNSREELQRAAGQVAFEAKVGGMSRIDDVVHSTDGKGLIAVERNPNNPHDVNHAYVDKQHAATVPLEQSQQQLAAETQRQVQEQTQDQRTQTQSPTR